MTKTMRKPILLALAFGLLLPAAHLFAQEMNDSQTTDVVPAYTPPAVVDASPVKLPKITKKVLKNGLTVYYIPQHEVPIATIRLTLPMGVLYNPPGKAGLTDFMASLLTKGTETRSATDISDAIDFVGGELDAGAGNNSTYVTADVLSRDLDLAFDLVSDVALHPTFPDDEIDRLRTQTLSSIMADKDNASTIASKEFSHWVYGDHPYGQPDEGTTESLQGMTRDDLVTQHDRLFVPETAILAIAGDFDQKKAEKLVKKYFGDWKKEPAPELKVEEPQVLEGGKILLVDKPDAVQTEIRMGYVLAPYNMGDDLYAFRVMDYLFGGGGFSSRLMLKVRNELGLTYGIYSYIQPRQQKGAYMITTNTRTPATEQMISEIYKMFDTVVDSGFTQKELDDAKAYMIGAYPRQFETPSQIAMQFQSLLLFDFGDPAEFIKDYRQNISNVTLEQVNALAKKYLKKSELRMTVVGNASEFEDALGQFGDVEKISVDDLKF